MRALAALTRLHTLQVRNSALAPTAYPDWGALAALTNLRELNMDNCNVGNGLLRIAPALARLTCLGLERTGVTLAGMHVLGGAACSLQALVLDKNQLGDQGAHALSRLTALTLLKLDFCGIGAKGVAALTALTSLLELNLGGFTYGHFPWGCAHAVAQLPTLRRLCMRNYYVGESDAAALTSLTALTWLDLAGDGDIGDAGAAALAHLTALRGLNLDYCGVTSEGGAALAALTQLEQLNLVDEELEDGGVALLTALTGLTSLSLQFEEQEGDESMRAVGGLTRLRSLALISANAKAVSELASLRSLTRLSLDGSGMEAEMQAVAQLTMLQDLRLHKDLIVSGPNDHLEVSHLSSLTSLTHLCLSVTEWGPEDMGAFASWTQLQHLDISSGDLEPAPALEIAELSALTHLNMRHNKCGGCRGTGACTLAQAAVP